MFRLQFELGLVLWTIWVQIQNFQGAPVKVTGMVVTGGQKPEIGVRLLELVIRLVLILELVLVSTHELILS